MIIQTRATGGVKLVAQELSKLQEVSSSIGCKIERARKGTPYIFVPQENIGVLFESEFSIVTVDPETLMSFIRMVDR